MCNPMSINGNSAIQIAIATILVLFLAVIFTPHATAQDGSPSSIKALEPLLEQARKAGSTVIVLQPNSAKNSAEVKKETAISALASRLERARSELSRVLAGGSQFVARIGQTLSAVGGQSGSTWVWLGLLLGASAVLVGRFVAGFCDRWGRNNFAYLYTEHPKFRSEKIGYLLFRAAMFLVMAIVSVSIATIIVAVIAGDDMAIRVTGLTIVGVYALVRVARLIFLNLLAPDAPSHRMIEMSDKDAAGLYRVLFIAYTIGAMILGACTWMYHLQLNSDAHKLALIAGSLVGALLLAGTGLSFRTAISGAILGAGEPLGKPLWRRLLAKFWYVLVIPYLFVAWLATAVRLLLDLPGSFGLVAMPILILVSGLALYGLALIVIERLFGRHLAVSRDESDTEADIERQIEAETPVFQGLAESAAAIFITVVGLLVLAALWGVDMTASGTFGNSLTAILVTLFLAYIAYKTVEIWIDHQIAQEEPPPAEGEDEDPGEAEFGQGTTRLGTLLPIFRNFLLITIVVIAGMIILGELGVNIGPLFAGAGVVGLAVGFGAQALVRDIFSGAFFLMDDAFRKGEYIDLGDVKGTVEKISIRSFQLRHHNGPLNTVPFGEIRFLKNFSRDWVLMKLKLRVTYDTDVEKVRKLIKKLGQELLEHPEIGPMFLQPLKSQGVYAMEESAMIIRVKFMTKPGDQFMARKLVYARIQELFREHGIKFAHRQVSVQISEPDVETSREAKLEAAAGAAHAVLDEGKPA